MTEPTHEHFDQVDADLRDVVDAIGTLMDAGLGREAVAALRLTLAAVWSDAQKSLVQSLMAGDEDLPRNPFYTEGDAAGTPAGVYRVL